MSRYSNKVSFGMVSWKSIMCLRRWKFCQLYYATSNFSNWHRRSFLRNPYLTPCISYTIRYLQSNNPDWVHHKKFQQMKKYEILKRIKELYDDGENIIQYLKKLDNSNSNTTEDILISYDIQAGIYTKNIPALLLFL